MSNNIAQLREIFRIASEHTLVLADARERIMPGGSRSSLMYRELAVNDNLVAHYRVWQRVSEGVPRRQQNGWEKYSPEGILLDREVRYSDDETSSIHH